MHSCTYANKDRTTSNLQYLLPAAKPSQPSAWFVSFVTFATNALRPHAASTSGNSIFIVPVLVVFAFVAYAHFFNFVVIISAYPATCQDKHQRSIERRMFLILNPPRQHCCCCCVCAKVPAHTAICCMHMSCVLHPSLGFLVSYLSSICFRF